MQKNFITLNLLFIAFSAFAQNKSYVSLDTEYPISFHGTFFIYQNDTIQLGPKSFFIDGQFSDEEIAKWPYVFNTINSAVLQLVNGTEDSPMILYIAPYVYWIDDPNDPSIRKPKKGSVPYGLEIKCEWLKFYGLNKKPENVVLACNRGQTIGAEGNFTMFKFDGQGTASENITFGNYCNVDLEFPLKPTLNRKKRAEAIVQAQLIHCNGDKIVARNTHFISRLNLCPFVGGERVFFDRCHFESTDDALCGTGVYKDCTLEFYSSKPFYHTTGTGAVFLNCDILSYTQGPQYFTKANGQVVVIDTRFVSETMSYVGWKDDPPPNMKNYQYNVSWDGKPLNIGQQHSNNTVNLNNEHLLNAYRFKHQNEVFYNTYNLLRGEDDWDPEGIKPIVLKAEKEQDLTLSNLPIQLKVLPEQSVLETKKDSIILKTNLIRFGNFTSSDELITWHISSEDKQYIQLNSIGNGNTCKVIPTNTTDSLQQVIITASTKSGLEGACVLYVQPAKLPPPTFEKTPKIKKTSEGQLWVEYTLQKMKFEDHSLVSWFRCKDREGGGAIKVAVSRMNEPLLNYKLTTGDIGYYIMVQVAPKHIRSDAGQAKEFILNSPINADDVKGNNNILISDFSNISVQNQTKIIPGFWTFAPFAEVDISNQTNAWHYGEGSQGSKDMIGLLQTGRTASMSYTPVGDNFGDMQLSILVSPYKTAGQGFSVAPLYMDVLIKYNPRTKTGYGIRFIRTTKYSNAVDCYFIEYDHNKIKPISEPISTNCYRPSCRIDIQVKGNKLSAYAQCESDYDKSHYPTEVKDVIEISTTIEPNNFGGFGVEYNGGSTVMLNEVKVKWD